MQIASATRQAQFDDVISFVGSDASGQFGLPVVGGAYLGRWLDGLAAGYSVRWTVSLTLLGVVIGAVNVYRYLEDHR